MTIGMVIATQEGYVMATDCLAKSNPSYLEEKLVTSNYEPRWRGEENTICGTVSTVSGTYSSFFDPFGIGGNLRENSKKIPHTAYDMFDSEVQNLSSSKLIEKANQLHKKGDKLECSRYEDLAALKNMIEQTHNGDAILFIGYSSERLPIVGAVKKGFCYQVDSYEIIGNGRKYIESFIAENYRPDLSLNDAIELVRNALNLCLSHTDDYQGYQIAVVSNTNSPTIEIQQDLQASFVPEF